MKLFAIIVASLFTGTVNAYAGSLFTPTLWAVAPEDGFACNLTNVGHKTRTVQVRIITNGTILLDSGDVALPPRHTTDHFVPGVENGAPIYCEFTFEGSEREFRGAAKLFHLPNSSDFAIVAAH